MANDDTNIQDDNADLMQDDSSADTSAEQEVSPTSEPQAASAGAAAPAQVAHRSAGVTIKVGSN